MELYSSTDKNKYGNNGSMYPCWYFEGQIAEMRESIAMHRHAIESGGVLREHLPEARAELEREEQRMNEIERAKPTLSDAERNKLHKLYKELGAKISESMFTRSDMERGLADAHEEAKRMKQPCIELAPDELAMAKNCGVQPLAGSRKVSRDAAAKVFKLAGKLLGEPTNIEHLRRDKRTDTILVN